MYVRQKRGVVRPGADHVGLPLTKSHLRIAKSAVYVMSPYKYHSIARDAASAPEIGPGTANKATRTRNVMISARSGGGLLCMNYSTVSAPNSLGRIEAQ
jgi:hypothetical protein